MSTIDGALLIVRSTDQLFTLFTGQNSLCLSKHYFAYVRIVQCIDHQNA